MQRGMHCRQTWLMRLVITSLCIRDSFLAAFLSPQNASSTQCPCICYQSCSAPVYTGSTLPIVQLMALLSVSWQGLTCLHINVPLAASGCMRHLPLPLTAQPLFPQPCIVGTLQSRVKGQLLLDPTSDESYHEDGTVLMAMMPTANLVSGACAKIFVKWKSCTCMVTHQDCIQRVWLQTCTTVIFLSVLRCSSGLVLCRYVETILGSVLAKMKRLMCYAHQC